MPFVALKIDVRSSIGMQTGLPAILHLLDSLGIHATIALSHGPERSCERFKDRKNMRRSGFPFTERFGWAAMFKGRLLPAGRIKIPDQAMLASWADKNHELVAGSYAPLQWQTRCKSADVQVTSQQFKACFLPFEGRTPTAVNAISCAGGAANRAFLRLEQRHGLLYGSDTFGKTPFWPVWYGEIIRCPQLPVTLPTLEQLVAEGNASHQEIAGRLVQQILDAPEKGQLMLIQADYDGLRFLPLLEILLKQLQASGIELGTCKDWLHRLEISKLPYHVIHEESSSWGLPALCQGPVFPA